MTSNEYKVFVSLIHGVHQKTFGTSTKIKVPSFTEREMMSTKIEEETGLTISGRSLQGYFKAILVKEPSELKLPSLPTLDTLARYVLEAEPIKSFERGNDYSFWIRFKEQKQKKKTIESKINRMKKPKPLLLWILIPLGLTVSFSTYKFLSKPNSPQILVESFSDTSDEYLMQNGWRVMDVDSTYWKQRGINEGKLTLFSLKGDSWVAGQKPYIKNLLFKELKEDCFDVEIYFEDFLPSQNWQNAGIIFLEDTFLDRGKNLRVSLVFSGPMIDNPLLVKNSRIILQVVRNEDNHEKQKEEPQDVLYEYNESSPPMLKELFKYTAIRVERRKNRFRVFSAYGNLKSTSFREGPPVFDFDLDVKYVGIFSIKSFRELEDPKVIQAPVDSFRIIYCE